MIVSYTLILPMS